MFATRSAGSPDGWTASLLLAPWRWKRGLFGKGKAPVMATVQEWLALGDRLYAKGVDVFNGSEVMESEAGTRDPKVVALTLLVARFGQIEG